MNILVTGGAGFIGSHLVDALLELNHDVSVLDDLSSSTAATVNPNASFYHNSIMDDNLDYLFETEKPDIVYHLAAKANIRNAIAEHDAMENIVGSVRLIQCCIKHNVQKIIFASSGGTVYGQPQYLPADEECPINPISPYGISKHTVEHYLYWAAYEHRLTYTTLRYGNVYGPGQGFGNGNAIPVFTDLLLKGERPTIFGDGKASRDYVYIDDLTEANLLALRHGDNQILNVGCGIETNVLGLCAALRGVIGVRIFPKYEKANPMEVNRVFLNSDKIRRFLGWEAKTLLHEGLARWYEWYGEEAREKVREGESEPDKAYA